LKTYIDFNTQQRKMAKTDFEKDFFLNWWIMQCLETRWRTYVRD
jgi:hypothetical protein